MLEACLALNRRYWSHDQNIILIAQTNLASCLVQLRRHDEALVLRREVFARRVEMMVSRTNAPSWVAAIWPSR